jgi:penicillin amidase
MLSALALFAAGQATPAIVRDAYGVPHIRAASLEQAFYYAGYAVAQDRLWQMENSRRLARGRMAEVYGRQFLASDQEILRTGYTDEELQAQYDRLAPRTRLAATAYARGVNAWIAEAKAKGLPEGYAQLGFAPEPWTVLDSAAVGVALLQRFGRGGAGEIRNMALLGYMQARPNAKGREFDLLDDFAFFDDPASPTTVRPEDDPLARNHPSFPLPDRKTTEQHAALLPKANLFELLPGIRIVSREESARVAERVAAPFKTGSYAIVVAPRRSTSGRAMLLSGPQMGFRSPSVVHEMSIQAPGFAVAGMDVPGVPGIVIGHTRDHAWGLTSGVADTDDIFFYPGEGADGYRYGNESRKLQVIRRTLRVKGEPDQTVEVQRTVDGPVVLRSASSGTLFAKRASYWGAEMRSFDAVLSLPWARDANSIERALRGATMSFNFFYATRKGDIGYLYTGRVPVRAPGLDPRLPTPGGPRYAWRGFIPPKQMPRVRKPRSGLIANWNNKPATWCPNSDTPRGVRVFR